MQAAHTKIIADYAGVGALYGFALSITLSTAGIYIFASVALLALAIFFKEFWRLMKTSWMVRIVLILSAYIIAHSWIALEHRPVLMENSNPNWSHFLLVGGLPSLALAFFMARKPWHTRPVLLSMIAVMAVGLGSEVDWLRVMSGEFSNRSLWEERSASETSFLAATGMIILLGTLCDRDIMYGSGPIKKLLGGIFMLGSGYFLIILIGSQTRGVWAGTALGLFLFLTILAVKDQLTFKRALAGIFGIATIIIIVGVYLDAERVWERRVDPVLADVSELIGEDLEKWQVQDRSVSHRANRWAQGLEAWMKKPLFGWGGGARAYVGGEVVDMPEKDSGHFHNLYIEWLAGFGALGLILFLALWLMMTRGLMRNSRENIGILAWILMAAVTVFVSTRIGRVDGKAVIILLTAVAMSRSLALSKIVGKRFCSQDEKGGVASL